MKALLVSGGLLAGLAACATTYQNAAPDSICALKFEDGAIVSVSGKLFSNERGAFLWDTSCPHSDLEVWASSVFEDLNKDVLRLWSPEVGSGLVVHKASVVGRLFVAYGPLPGEERNAIQLLDVTRATRLEPQNEGPVVGAADFNYFSRDATIEINGEIIGDVATGTFLGIVSLDFGTHHIVVRNGMKVLFDDSIRVVPTNKMIRLKPGLKDTGAPSR